MIQIGRHGTEIRRVCPDLWEVALRVFLYINIDNKQKRKGGKSGFKISFIKRPCAEKYDCRSKKKSENR
jgi:hypothetical protein